MASVGAKTPPSFQKYRSTEVLRYRSTKPIPIEEDRYLGRLIRACTSQCILVASLPPHNSTINRSDRQKSKHNLAGLSSWIHALTPNFCIHIMYHTWPASTILYGYCVITVTTATVSIMLSAQLRVKFPKYYFYCKSKSKSKS